MPIQCKTNEIKDFVKYKHKTVHGAWISNGKIAKNEYIIIMKICNWDKNCTEEKMIVKQ